MLMVTGLAGDVAGAGAGATTDGATAFGVFAAVDFFSVHGSVKGLSAGKNSVLIVLMPPLASPSGACATVTIT